MGIQKRKEKETTEKRKKEEILAKAIFPCIIKLTSKLEKKRIFLIHTHGNFVKFIDFEVRTYLSINVHSVNKVYKKIKVSN